MSLDGGLLRHLRDELKREILGCRINKIYQPAKYEISLLLRGRDSMHRLVISASAESPRINLTERSTDNPNEPPAFCMLLRKKISSAKIVGIEQKFLERALCINLETKDEMGYDTSYKLIVEIMGKHSNIILVNSEDKIVDSIKRVTPSMSSKRTVLPGLLYADPPSQDKICILDTGKEEIVKKIFSFAPEKTLLSAIQSSVQGISKTTCEKVIEREGLSSDMKLCSLGPVGQEKVVKAVAFISDIIKNTSGRPYLVKSKDGRTDISFVKSERESCKEYDTFSRLVDDYYIEKSTNDRINSRAGTLVKFIEKLISSRKRKVSEQKKELIECSEKEKYKIFGDLLISNLYKIRKGMTSIELINFFSKNHESINIKLDVRLDGSQNVQKYYKKYKKLKTAEVILKEQIESAESDVVYLENALDSLERSESETEINEINRELCEQGYIKNKKKIKGKAISFIESISPGGYKILIGRNCKQNEELTYKIAKKKDWWFHVKDLPGSHTIMLMGEEEPQIQDIVFAASICAGHSKAKFSSNVAVDYTSVSNVKKPKNYKPGMAIYKNYKTVYVSPNNMQC